MRLKTVLKKQSLLTTVLKFAHKRDVKIYLVGGYLRDIYLNRVRENPDIDFALSKGSIDFARGLAKHIKSGFVVLDKTHGCARLVKRLNHKTYTLDFTDFRGETLKEDLWKRDFTINTLALDLDKRDELLDYYQGLEDLKSKKIKVVNKNSFNDDPVRILRAFSLSSLFGFRIDKNTLNLIKIKKNKLKRVSFERIRDELFKILENRDSFNYFKRLDNLNILSIIIPEIELMRGVQQGPYHHLGIWQHSLESLRQLEGLLKEIKRNKDIKNYLNKEISSGRTRLSLIKLASLLHDVGKPKSMRKEDGKIKFHGHERMGFEITKGIVERLRLANDELDLLKKIILFHLRPGYLADVDEVTRRAVFRYFRDTQQEAVSTLLISIADQRATKGRLTTNESRRHHEQVCFRLMREYFRKEKQKKPARIITGDDLIEKFKLETSPLIGKILSEIEELQAIGKIKTKKQALKIAQDIIKTEIDK